LLYIFCMALWTDNERAFLEAVSHIAFGNPFLPDLARQEQAALGPEYKPEPPFWSLPVGDPDRRSDNAWKVAERAEELLAQVPARNDAGVWPARDEALLYEDAALYVLYHRYYERLGAVAAAGPYRAPFYDEFRRDWDRWLEPRFLLHSNYEPAHVFAAFFQIARAFRNIFVSIIGSSGPAGRLRAAVWQSIFTHDIRRYRRTFYNRMSEFVTLVTGPSGSGKELVARAIALSRYLPFDERERVFPGDPDRLFHPVHIAALSPTLVESELFGHRKGAFTGAVQDRRGYLDTCPSLGAVFLDEVGELSPDIQVKLLRVIETRAFTAVGDTERKKFGGKLIAATHRDLAAMAATGAFREDLYYRMCSDLVETPSLASQLADAPEALPDLVRYMAIRHAGEEAESIAGDAIDWVRSHLGPNYSWPGNYRELEQFVRNFIIRRDYRPARLATPAAADDLFAPARDCQLTADELLTRYCTLVYARSGSYEAAAKLLGLDRRTVKAKVDERLLAGLRGSSPRPRAILG